MNGTIAYFLLYIGTAFFCSFDSAVKDRLERTDPNKTKLPDNFSINGTKANHVFDFQCESFACLTRNLKLFNENGEVIKDGWISGMELLSGNNSAITDSFKRKLNVCVPKVNQKLSYAAPNNCSKYRIGFELLNKCADRIK